MKPEAMRILLTGAAGGIGREVAARLAARGASLLLTSANGEKLTHLGESLEGYGRRVAAVPADLASETGRQALISAARSFPGGINVLINNAACNTFGRFAAGNPQTIERMLMTNVAAPMLLTQALLPVLESQRRALIMNVGSIIGSIGMPGQVLYCSSKFALHGFTEALRRELSDSQIGVLWFAPRTTDTGMNGEAVRRFNRKLGVGMDSPASVAAQLIECLVAETPECYLGWPERLIVRLNGVLPRLVDRLLTRQSVLLNQIDAPSTDAVA